MSACQVAGTLPLPCTVSPRMRQRSTERSLRNALPLGHRVIGQAKTLSNAPLSTAHLLFNTLHRLATSTRSDTLVMAGVIARALCPAVSKWMQSSLGSVTQGSKLFMSSLPAVEQTGLPRLPDFAHTPAPYKGPSAEEVLALRKAHLSPCRLLRAAFGVSSGPNPKSVGSAWIEIWLFIYAALFLHFKKPVMIVEGKMQYLYDEKGRRYLDVSPSVAKAPSVVKIFPASHSAAYRVRT